MNKNGDVLALSPGAGVPCAGCGSTAAALSFREFGWVLGMVWFDRIHRRAGYLCSSCRRRWFFKYQGLTLLLGWWGVFALLIRNPYTILKNTKALFRSPLFPDSSGAINLRDLQPEELHPASLPPQALDR